jgi:2-octaprenyl-6-methoxyphenol hydroxylase
MIVNKPKQHYDVIVIGGGMVGSSFALALEAAFKSTALSILVIEASKPHQEGAVQNESFDARSTALSYGSSQILEQAGLWDGLSEHAAAIEKIHVSDKGRFGSAHLDCADYGLEALGYVVENKTIGTMLSQALAQSENIHHLSEATVTSSAPRVQGMLLNVKVADAETQGVTANLTVLADGGRSPLCSKLGIAIESEDYGQHGLIANIAFTKPHQNQAFERFTESGPLAVLPLQAVDGENRASLVWTVLEHEVTQTLAMDQLQLLAKLQQSFGDRLGTITRIGKLAHYPLALNQASEQVRPGLVLLGNVAHTLHPVAGQGLNLALRDAQALVRSLREAKVNGEGLGDIKVLQRYIEKQAADQRSTIAATDSLVRLFSSSKLTKVLLRKFGLVSLEMVPAMKRMFAQQAMGLTKP